ncbi:MAG: hypothetical protein JO197_01890 [Acidobacteria bacterium]|nr:hypothetical protein [Acidobacteriota bacterium]MBV9478915.1 hypothetical protein [Acidobacteriota bacterium]
MRRLLVLLLPLLAAASMHAADFSGTDLFIPVAGRVPGQNGTFWQTDLNITNVEDSSAHVMVLFFDGTPGGRSFNVTINAHGTLVIKDFARERFQLDNAMGPVEVHSIAPISQFPSEPVRLLASAWIYNAQGEHAQFGQVVQGVPTVSLPMSSDVAGLIGSAERRANAGIANPFFVTASFTATLYDADGVARKTIDVDVEPRNVHQFSVFPEFGVEPFDGATVHFASHNGVPVYTYGSIIQNENGDPSFVIGTGTDTLATVVTPQCADPAPLWLAGQLALPGWWFTLRDGADEEAFKARYGLVDLQPFADPGFMATATPSTIATIRCDSDVVSIEQFSEGTLVSGARHAHR